MRWAARNQAMAAWTRAETTLNIAYSPPDGMKNAAPAGPPATRPKTPPTP
jgi:hypothetical protein